MTLIRSKQIAEVKIFNNDTGMCVLKLKNSGVIRIHVKQCEKELADRVLEHYANLSNKTVESKQSVRRWWEIWKIGKD